MPREYRSRTRIIFDLLAAVRDEKDAAVTRLLFLANLSHDRLTGYLKELMDRQWILEKEEDGRRSWSLTEEGRRVLIELDKIHRFMDDFGLEL